MICKTQYDSTPPLRLEGTPFRKAVWEILFTIPYGQFMTYGEIAGKIAEQRGLERMSAQAVGNDGKRGISEKLSICRAFIDVY